jgi:hypothetical protein
VGAAVRSLDGHVLTVDGSSGIVVIHDDTTDERPDGAAAGEGAGR